MNNMNPPESTANKAPKKSGITHKSMMSAFIEYTRGGQTHATVDPS